MGLVLAISDKGTGVPKYPQEKMTQGSKTKEKDNSVCLSSLERFRNCHRTMGRINSPSGRANTERPQRIPAQIGLLSARPRRTRNSKVTKRKDSIPPPEMDNKKGLSKKVKLPKSARERLSVTFRRKK